MSETKTEPKPRAPFKWLIPIQTSKTTTTFGRPELQAACRGSEDMAIQLNYFAYEASSEAQNNKIDIEQVDFIRITRSQDEIMKGILNCVSKKTHIKQMHKFEEWGFIRSDAHRHIYDIYFKKIAEAIETPPPVEKRKPRGRHVSQKVKSTNSDVKSTNCKLEDEIVPDCTFNSEVQIVKLQLEMVNLQNQIVKLQLEMVNLQNRQSYESAPRVVSSVFEGRTDSIDYNRLREIDTYVVANANDDTPIFSFPVIDSEITQVSDESFVAALDDWKVYRPATKIVTSSQALEQILNRFSNQPSSEFSTPVTDLSPESVDKSAQTDNNTSAPLQASEQSYSRTTTQPTTPEPTQPPSEKPARPARTRKPKVSVDLDHVEPVPAPAMPDESIPWSARKILLWGDFFRGHVLEPSESGNSNYVKNEKAAIQLFKRGISEKSYVSIFRFMRGKKIVDGKLEDDANFCDDWWPGNVSADVRHVEKHFDDMVAKIKGNRGKQTKSTVQQELEKEAEGFTIKSQSELMKMQPEKRKEYGRELNAFLAIKKETEKQQAQAEQASSQKAG